MIKKTIQDALNQQINEELFSAYLYLSMAAQFDEMNLGGFSHWMEKQAQEELEHAMKFYHFINERGGRVELQAIKVPQKDWDSASKMMSESLAHEEHITTCIHNLVELATREKDYATMNMLQWFVNEQVEEEAGVTKIVEKLKLIGERGQGLFMLDRELGARD
ncbi:MAG TPA: ferritin [Candidatus Aminicenantes bacterium]|nr:ferritin [Candidatus Aminicenantes bacterium]